MTVSREMSFDGHWTLLEPRLKGYLFRALNTSEDAEDLLQEVALGAWKKFDSMPTDFNGYVFGITKNLVKKYIRDKGTRPQVVSSELDHLPDGKPDLIESYGIREIVRKCLDKLGLIFFLPSVAKAMIDGYRLENPSPKRPTKI